MPTSANYFGIILYTVYLLHDVIYCTHAIYLLSSSMDEYTTLVLGIGLLIAFGWIVIKNRKRTGVLHALIRIDTMLSLVAGLYLIVTSTISLLH